MSNLILIRLRFHSLLYLYWNSSMSSLAISTSGIMIDWTHASYRDRGSRMIFLDERTSNTTTFAQGLERRELLRPGLPGLLAPQPLVAVFEQTFEAQGVDRRAFDVGLSVELERWIDERERQRRPKVIGRDLLLREDRHRLIFDAVGVHVELARERLEPVEVDHVVDPRRMIAQAETLLRQVRRAPCGEHQRHPVGEQPARQILARNQARQRL